MTATLLLLAQGWPLVIRGMSRGTPAEQVLALVFCALMIGMAALGKILDLRVPRVSYRSFRPRRSRMRKRRIGDGF
ncbi:MAG: hypothetical protein MUC63_06965 [Planctomycetes bacterium]|jgi:hypothetical protein|nr:hypothetical protein [Planctomycetota bacterium]